VGEPRRTIEKVYAQLGLPLTPEFAAVLEAEQRRARRHETSNRYSLEEFGLRADAIREAMPELFAAYAWDERAEEAPMTDLSGPGR
jgi:hypothetical protein